MANNPEITEMWQALLLLDGERRRGVGRKDLIAAAERSRILARTAEEAKKGYADAGTDDLAPVGLYLPLIVGPGPESGPETGPETETGDGGGRPAVHVVAQLGSSLDGRIATESGHSHYINGPENIVHLHRLRALSDAVIVGAETVIRDDARLTTRRVDGPSPVRVIIDPGARLRKTATALSDNGPQTLVLTGPEAIHGDAGAGGGRLGQALVCRMPPSGVNDDGGFKPEAIIGFLRGRGFTRLFVEGGGRLVSAFLAAGRLNRLHVCVAPMIIGSGRPGFVLPPIDTLDQAIRAPAMLYRQGADILFDLDLTAQRRLASVTVPK